MLISISQLLIDFFIIHIYLLLTNFPSNAITSHSAFIIPNVHLNRINSRLYETCSNCKDFTHPDAKFCMECGAACGQKVINLSTFVNDIYLPRRQSDVSYNTYRVESGFWKLINRDLGHLPMSQIDVKTWEDYLSEMRKRKCTPRTQQLHQMTFLNAFKYAQYCGYLDSIPNLRKIRGTTNRSRQIIPFTVNETKRLLLNTDKKHRAMFALGIGMGLRPTELLSIKWTDIDFERKMLYVRGSKTKGSSVSIPFTDLAFRETLKWWKYNRQPKTGLLFKAPKNPKKQMGAAKRAHVDITSDGTERRIFPYLLRHSFATLAATSNPPVPIPVTQAIMRHTSSRMILEIYAKAGALAIQEGLQNFAL